MTDPKALVERLRERRDTAAASLLDIVASEYDEAATLIESQAATIARLEGE